MDRKDFIKLLGLAGLSLKTPSALLAKEEERPISRKKETLIYVCFARGLYYYSFDHVKKQLKIGQELILKREPKNPYDEKAIAIYFDAHKLGFVPREDNLIVANLIDSAFEMKAFIEDIDWSDGLYEALQIKFIIYS